MKIFSIILQGFYIILGFCSIFLMAIFWVKPELIQSTLEFSQQNILIIGITALTIILVSILWLVYWVDFRIRTKSITLENPEGKVRISLKAIEEFIITKIVSQIRDIHAIRVRAAITSRGLETLISLKIAENYNIPELTAQIQELTKNYLQDVVGVERVSHIEIILTGISSETTQTSDSDFDDAISNEDEPSS
jgi:uncharacterized alkaline shock family protein YloU